MLGVDPEQLDEVPSEDLFLLRVVQERRVQNEVDIHRPVKGVVGAVEM